MGVTINEAMNNACCVIANEKIGSIPFLIENNINGLIYKNYNELEDNIIKVINNKEEREKLSTNAYNYIKDVWNPKVAASNLIKLSNSLYKNKKANINKGPCSKIN